MNGSPQDYIHASLEETARVMETVSRERGAVILRAVGAIAKAMSAGGKLLVCGNGGSAADAQHVAAEFVGRFSKTLERGPLPALALTTDTSFLTAFCNDYCFEDLFVRQVEALGQKGDVLLGVSTSGNSENVLRAFLAARKKEMVTIGLTGQGGRLGDKADISIEVPSRETPIIQNVHLAIEHIICGLVEKSLFPAGMQACPQKFGSDTK